MDTPLLSVCLITYNHAKYICEALDGVLMQKVNFTWELIIADDFSTDGTREIILDYKEKNPDFIKLIFQKENVGPLKNWIDLLSTPKSKYIAYFEGDDYWTDPYKLQKQVDFLEANEEYSICFHRYKILDDESKKFREDGCGFLFDNAVSEGITIDVQQFLSNWITQPLTKVFRNKSLDLSLVYKYRFYKDMHIIYHILKNGKGYLFAFEGGVYREHLGGIHSKQTLKYQCENGLAVAKEIYLVNGTNPLKENYLKTLQWVISTYTNNHFKNRIVLKYIFEHFYYSKDLKPFIKNLRYYLGIRYKSTKVKF